MKNQLEIFKNELSAHYIMNFTLLNFYPTERNFTKVCRMVENGFSPEEIADYFLTK
jgi:hypothetical protein